MELVQRLLQNMPGVEVADQQPLVAAEGPHYQIVISRVNACNNWDVSCVRDSILGKDGYAENV